MTKWSCRWFGEAVLVLGIVALALSVNALGGQAPGDAAGLLDKAIKAEASSRFDVAVTHLYQIVLEHPRSRETSDARLRLARLLGLFGDTPAALLQCQALREQLPADHPMRQPAFDLATTLARRLRITSADSMLSNVRTLPVRGITEIEEVTSVQAHASGAWLVVDSGKSCAYRVAGESATVLGRTEELSAATFLPDGTVVFAGKSGITVGDARPVRYTGAWGGRKREVKKVRALAALGSSDLLVIDKDYDGVLRCAISSGTCAPWGPPTKMRSVHVGPSDLVVMLDDRQESVRVLDAGGRQLAAAGPIVAGVKLEEIVDATIDGSYGVYLLDANTRTVQVMALRAPPPALPATSKPGAAVPAAAGTDKPRMTLERIGRIVAPGEGDRAVKSPSAVGVMPDGSVVLAGRGIARLVKFQ